MWIIGVDLSADIRPKIGGTSAHCAKSFHGSWKKDVGLVEDTVLGDLLGGCNLSCTGSRDGNLVFTKTGKTRVFQNRKTSFWLSVNSVFWFCFLTLVLPIFMTCSVSLTCLHAASVNCPGNDKSVTHTHSQQQRLEQLLQPPNGLAECRWALLTDW